MSGLNDALSKDTPLGANREHTLTITIDDVFSKHIGEFGRQQVWLFSIVSLAWLPSALATLNMAFFGAGDSHVISKDISQRS
jgi:hypothetical protein